MSTEPHDERDFFAGLELRTPRFLPGVSASATYRRNWNKVRVDRFLQTASDASGLSREQIAERVAEQDEMTDLIEIAAVRINERGDRSYSDVLGRLVAAALIDEAKIDPITYLLDRIVKLDPVHVRVLVRSREADAEEAELQGIADEEGRREALTRWRESKPVVLEEVIIVDALNSSIGVPGGIIEGCLDDLCTIGFAERMGGEYVPSNIRFIQGGSYSPIYWKLSGLGRAAADEILATRDDLLSQQ